MTGERIVFDADGLDRWVAHRVQVPGWLGPHHSVAFYRDGALVGAAVFDAFTQYDCCIHLAILEAPVPVWVLRAVFGYPFTQLRLRRVTGLVRAGNEAALALAKRNGFVEEGRKRKAMGDDDEIILGLLREDCEHCQ